MKSFLVILVFLISSFTFSQWNTVWSSPSVSDTYLSGLLNFSKTTNGWEKRFYAVDSNKFQIMTAGYSLTPEFTYSFNPAEKFAGGLMYSLGLDLTGDGKTEFYVMAYYGTATNYRSSFKIINIVNNSTVFEKNETNFSFSYPTLLDINGDGIIECLVTKYNFPYTNKYYYEIYNTGIAGGGMELNSPLSFKLNQNYPNPFNPNTIINYTTDRESFIELKIFDITGKTIKILVNENKPQGVHNVSWGGEDQNGVIQPSGVYFYELKTNGRSIVKKMLLLK
jgi:hypothetical protein